MVVSPFLYSLFGAAFIAIALYPMHEFVKRQVEGETIPALISTLIVLIFIIGPLTTLTLAALDQGRTAYATIADWVRSGGIETFLRKFEGSPFGRFGFGVSSAEEAAAWIRGHGEQISSLGLSVVTALLGGLTTSIGRLALIVLFLFFIFRDGAFAFRQVSSWTPLTPEQAARLEATVRDTMAANVYGILAVGGAQGLLTGLLFWGVGLPSPVAWGVFAFFASLLPPFGAALIWFPGALFLLTTGAVTKGLIVLGVGAGVVSMADNVIRPLAIQGRARLGTLAVLVSLLGGLQVFGLIGMFAGPLIVALTAEVWSMLREEMSAARS